MGLGGRQRDLAGRADRLAEGEDPEGGPAGGEAGDGETGGGYAGLDEAARERLEAIARLQERAARELERGNTLRANRLQEQATGSLRDLSDEIAAALDELEAAMAGDRESTEDSERLDPFGRPVGGNGDGDNVSIPDEAERQRARDILDELRPRFEDAEDAEEREYLERLLDRF